jgi:class 3 adenylate cyclase/tetratricopeptide (TPR) repeat protein
MTSSEDGLVESQEAATEKAERQRLQTLLKTIVPYLPLPVVEKQLADPEVGRVEGEYWEGSVLFADLSGFTALSETLSRLGKQGAEVITDVVNDLFGALLEDVERYGGILVKFGGDAMTVYFGGNDHALGAARAGLVLQETMGRRFVNLETPGGVFTLRLRVGVHTGRIFAAQVGCAPGLPLRGMELVVTGADINRVAQAQDYAAPGEVCITAQVLTQVGDQAEVEPVGGGMYRLKGLNAVEPAAASPPVAWEVPSDEKPLPLLRRYAQALRPYLPVDLADERISDPSDPELRPDLRPVAVLFANFADLSGILAAVAGRESPDLRLVTEILNTYYARMQEVIGRYGGLINKVDMYTHGDKLMAIFGAPQAHGDDAERAVRAALEMQVVMAEVNRIVQRLLEEAEVAWTPLTQRIGVNYGHVFAGNVGSEREGSRREYTVMGDTVNLAARLMAAAEEGEILISPSVRRQVSAKFKLEDLPPIRVKGKAQPVAVSRPLRPLTEGERAPLRHGRRPFIGRQVQLEALLAAARQTIAGKGQVVVVVGEAGTGKTRLVGAFQEGLEGEPDASDLSCYVTELPSYAQEPYAPIVDLLRHVIGLTGDTAADVVRLNEWIQAQVPELSHFSPLMGNLLALPIADNPVTAALTPEQRRDRLYDLIEQALHSQAQHRPLALVVDDLQWGDDSSLALLGRLASGLVAVPMMLVLCYRPDVSFATAWTELTYTRALRVAEFSPQESAQLVAELLETDALSEGLAEMVWSRAQGNPFFTEEFVKSLRETGAIARSNGGWQLVGGEAALTAIPDTIEGMVLARLDRLEVRCRDALQEAAVVAASRARFTSSLLARVHRQPAELPERLHDLVGEGLLEALESELEALEYHFRHTLTREVAYDSLLFARRRELHRLIAQATETLYADRLDEYLTSLAHHCLEAGEWARAFDYQFRAGERAQSLFANKEAIGFFEKALAIVTERLPDMLAAMSSQDLGKALTNVFERLSDVMVLEGRFVEALDHLSSARAMVEAEMPSVGQMRHLADLCRKSAVVYERRSEYEAAFEWLDKGLEYLDLAEPAIEAARIYLLGTGVCRRQGRNDEAIDWCEKSLEVASRIETREGQQVLAQAYYNLGGIYTDRADWPLAEQFCRESVRVFQRIDDIVGLPLAHINLANVYFAQGNWSQANEHYLQALEITRRTGDVYWQGFITINLGGVYLNQGGLEQADSYYQQSMEVWQKLGSTYVIALLHNNIGTVALRRGNPDQALALLEKSAALFQEIGSEDFMAEVHRHLAEAHLGRVELDQALEAAQQSLTMAREKEMRLEEGGTRRVLGQVHRARQEPDQAEQEFKESLDILEELNSHYEMGQTLYHLACLYRDQERDSEAEVALIRAIEVFERLGARLDLQWARDLEKGGDAITA